MTDYKNKLSSLGEKLKSTSNSTPIQEVKPVKKNKKEDTILTTIYLDKKLHRKIKTLCIKADISMKEFITEKLREIIE